MKKIFIAIPAVLLLGGIGFWMSQKASRPPAFESGTAVESGTGQEETYTGNLKKLLGLGKSLKCTWSSESASGTSWIKGQNVYNEVQAEGQVSKTVMKDNCLWVWTEGQPQGMKSCYESFDEMQQAEIESPSEEAVTEPGLGEMAAPPDMNYSCRVSVVSDALFSPPPGVDFMDMDELMPSDLEDVEDVSQEDLEELQRQMEDLMP